MKKSILIASSIAASFALFTACGDDVTKVTEKASLGQVKEFAELPNCEEGTEGSLVYVKDSAKVFACTGNGWAQTSGSGSEESGNIGAKSDIDSTGAKGDDGKNGTGCTAEANKDKTGFDISCDGKFVGTIENGKNGATGEGCTATEGKNGQIVVTCGKNSVTLFKASCGTHSYDPATQFCAFDMNVYPLCHKALEGFEQSLNADNTYDVESYFCDVTDLLVPLCNAQPYDFTTQFCAGYKYGAVPRCSKEPAGLGHLSEDGVYSRDLYFCDANDSLVALCGGSTYDTKLQYCDLSGTEPQVVALCGGQQYELETHMCVDGQIKEAIACCIPEGQNSKWCDGHPNSLYDVRKQFCDTRDGRPYKFIDVTAKDKAGNVVYSETWMAENLNYAGTEESESDCFGGISSNCDADGRLYTWNAALDYCPDGWDLPTKQQYAALFDAANNYGISYKFLDHKAGFYGPSQSWVGHGTISLIWTSSEGTSTDAVRLEIAKGAYVGLVNNPKTNLEAVICIKNK